MKTFENTKPALIFKIIVGVIFLAAITIFGITFLVKRKHASKTLYQDISRKTSVRATLNNLDTKSIIKNRHQVDNKSYYPIKHKKKKLQKPSTFNKDVSKLTTADGTVEFSMKKLSVLPSGDELPAIDVVGGVEIHLDQKQKKKSEVEYKKDLIGEGKKPSKIK